MVQTQKIGYPYGGKQLQTKIKEEPNKEEEEGSAETESDIEGCFRWRFRWIQPSDLKVLPVHQLSSLSSSNIFSYNGNNLPLRSCTPIRRGWKTYLEMAKDSSHLRLLLLLSLSSSHIFILNCTDLLKSPSESSIRFKSGEKNLRLKASSA